jgi:hypothetical protein
METLQRRRGRPLGPPGASLRLAGLEGHPGILQGGGEAIWTATALTEVGLRLHAASGGSGLVLNPRDLRVLADGLHVMGATGALPVDAQMSLGCAGLRIAANWVDGAPQASLRWAHSPGILLIGDEIVALAAVAALVRDFAREFRAYPRLDYWAGEAAEIPSVELMEAATGIPLPRRLRRSSAARVAA